MGERIDLGGGIVASFGEGTCVPGDVYTFAASGPVPPAQARRMALFTRLPWPARYRPRRERRASTKAPPMVMRSQSLTAEQCKGLGGSLQDRAMELRAAIRTKEASDG